MPGVEETVLHEYDAIRDEILLRLGFQQQIIQYTFLVIGLLAPLLGLQSYISLPGLLAAVLVGPIICIFLQLIYYKQHIFVELLSGYIAADLGKMEGAGNTQHSLRGWERYLTTTLYVRMLPNWFSAVLGFAEGMFPALIGGLYLLIFIGLGASYGRQLNVFWKSFLVIWFLADVIGIIIVVIGSFVVRGWAATLRKSAIKEPEKTE